MFKKYNNLRVANIGDYLNGGTKKPEISNDRENSYNPDNRFAGYLASDIFQECVYNAAVKTVGRALQTAANVVDFYQSLPEDSVRKKIIDGTGKTAKTVWGAVSLPFRAPKMIYESLGPEDKKIIDKTIEIGEYIFASPFLIPAALYDNLQRTGRITDRRKKKKEKYEASHPTRIDKKIVERTKSEAVFAKNLFGVGYNPLGLDDVPEVKKSIKGSSSYKSSLRFNIESEGNQPQILFADHIIAEGSGKSYTFKQFMNYWGKRGRMNSRVLSKERGNNVFIGSPEGELTEIPQKVKGKIDIGNIVDSARYAYQGFVNVHREEPTDVKIELKPGTMITEDGVIVSGILGYMKLKNSEGNSEEIQIAPDGNLLQINGNSLISPYINAAAEFANTINSEYGIKNWEMIVNNDIRRNEAARRDLIIAREKIQKSKNYRENIKTERSPEIVTAAYKIMSNAMRTGNPERVDMAIQYLSAKYGMKKEDISNLVPPKLTKVPRVRKKNKIIMHTALQFMQAARPDNYSFDLTDSESSFNMEHYIQNKQSE